MKLYPDSCLTFVKNREVYTQLTLDYTFLRHRWSICINFQGKHCGGGYIRDNNHMVGLLQPAVYKCSQMCTLCTVHLVVVGGVGSYQLWDHLQSDNTLPRSKIEIIMIFLRWK